MKMVSTVDIVLMNVPLVKMKMNVLLVLPTLTGIKMALNVHVKMDIMMKVLQPVLYAIPNVQPVQHTKHVLHVPEIEFYQNVHAQRVNGITITLVKIVTINVKDVTPVLPTAPEPMIAPPTD
jgi:hypothetical protein